MWCRAERAGVRATRHSDSVWVDLLMCNPAGPTPTLLLWRSCISGPGAPALSQFLLLLFFVTNNNAFTYFVLCLWFFIFFYLSFWILQFILMFMFLAAENEAVQADVCALALTFSAAVYYCLYGKISKCTSTYHCLLCVLRVLVVGSARRTRASRHFETRAVRRWNSRMLLEINYWNQKVSTDIESSECLRNYH